MLGDWPVTGERIDTSTYSDVVDDIYSIESGFLEQYSPVRKINQVVVGLGEDKGVRTYIIPAPLICKPSSLSYTHLTYYRTPKSQSRC